MGSPSGAICQRRIYDNSLLNFCEDICNLEFDKHMRRSNTMIIVSFTNRVTINLNIFGSFMEDRIFGDPYCTSIVSMKSVILVRKAVFRLNQSKLNNFLLGEHSQIFCFCRRWRSAFVSCTFIQEQ